MTLAFPESIRQEEENWALPQSLGLKFWTRRQGCKDLHESSLGKVVEAVGGVFEEEGITSIFKEFVIPL